MLEVQKALRERIAQIAPNIPVLDRYPHKQDAKKPVKMPYIVIGEDSFAPFETDDQTGFDISITLQIWGVKGMSEIKGIQKALYDGLNRYCLNVEGMRVLTLSFTGANCANENDGVTTRGVLSFDLKGLNNG